jgi:Kef-type K+ transport system membrane component KefB
LGWSVAYLLGPGFTVSVGVVVSPLSQSAADVTLPAIPWLAGVPTGGGVLTMLVLIPVGLITGVVLARRLRSIERWQSRAVGIGVAAVTTGVIVGLACGLSAGAVGTDRLASIGPNSIASALVAILVVALGATLVEVARYVRRRFRED